MIRAWSPRWRCRASRGAIPSGVSNARARWALRPVTSPRYSHIRPIPETGQDMTGEPVGTADADAADGGWVRGGDYYANMGR